VNYFPFHLGDYAAHTAHLEPLEDLAYRRMLDAYYLREAPLPADVDDVARLIRMRQHLDVVEAVLREFFALTDDGWRHERCDEEIERMQDKQAKARASAAASVNARRAKAESALNERQATVERTLNERSTDVELPTPTPTPTPTPKKTRIISPGCTTEDDSDSKIPSAIPNPALASSGAVSALLRSHGIDAQPADPRVIALSQSGTSLDTIAEAAKRARDAKPGERIGIAYVAKILDSWAKQASGISATGSTPSADEARRAEAKRILGFAPETDPSAGEPIHASA
jgi:uncharacterized protein YdaU (DUF1376 family)